jgi:hypothetical protein
MHACLCEHVSYDSVFILKKKGKKKERMKDICGHMLVVIRFFFFIVNKIK